MAEEQRLNVEAARKALLEEQRQRWALCEAEIEAVLKKYGCLIVARPVITAEGRIAVKTSLADRPDR